MSENIVSYTSKELALMQKQGKSQTDWQRVITTKDEDIEAAIKADPDGEEISDEDWESAKLIVPLELAPEMMSWLQAHSENYQVHIQRLIREAMQSDSLSSSQK